MSPKVKLSRYETALNALNDLPVKQHRIFERALQELRTQRDEWKNKYEDLETRRASCCVDMESMLKEIRDLYPYVNCVCGRNKPRLSDKQRERLIAVLSRRSAT